MRASPAESLRGDGTPWIWNLAAEHVPGAAQIMDRSHAKERMWDVAHAVFGGATKASAARTTLACSLLEEGRMSNMISASAALLPIPPEPGQARCIPQQAMDSFPTHAEHLRAPVLRAQGMPSGGIDKSKP